jgi:segregation and condensation protein A
LAAGLITAMDNRLTEDEVWKEGPENLTDRGPHDAARSVENPQTAALTQAEIDDWERPVRVRISPTLHLDGFDGPMDLLLDLAERQRIDFGRMSILDLAEQFVTAMEGLSRQVPLERRADWLVLATRLVLLRSRLLFPESPAEKEKAEEAAVAELKRVDDLVFFRAAAGWLTRRPQLGIDAFARPPIVAPREGGYVALMEACLVVLRGPERMSEGEPVYAPAIPDLWHVADALNRIAELIVTQPDAGAGLPARLLLARHRSQNGHGLRRAIPDPYPHQWPGFLPQCRGLPCPPSSATSPPRL